MVNIYNDQAEESMIIRKKRSEYWNCVIEESEDTTVLYK